MRRASRLASLKREPVSLQAWNSAAKRFALRKVQLRKAEPRCTLALSCAPEKSQRSKTHPSVVAWEKSASRKLHSVNLQACNVSSANTASEKSSLLCSRSIQSVVMGYLTPRPPLQLA